ncbi:gfo/Idh/MocA family oxidoreductase, partial [bacterium]|nr:gfo/Idh/MocA family oxidoreductase [bacterium]
GFLHDKAAQVVAVSDLKSHVLKNKQNLVNTYYDNKDCKAYHDFRDVVDRDDIDACMVATCDHWHVLASLYAVRAGKDVYCEKPMGLSLEEDQTLREEVRKHNRIFQFGTQQRSDPKFQLACQLAREGKIGDIHTINVWSPGSSAGGDPTPVPVPEWLDYDFWLGPAPYKPYTENRCSNKLWWFISDYALGFIAGWGIHPLDIALWGARDKFTGPWTLKGTGQFPREGVADTALNWDIDIEFGSGMKMRFTGNPYPNEWKKRYEDECGHGTAFEGSDGWIYVRRGKISSSPKSLVENAEFPEGSDQYTNSTDAHVSNFLDSMRTRKPPLSEIGVSVEGDMLCHVSDIAIRLEKEMRFDPKKERFIDDKQGNRRLRRFMRKPWKL